MNLPLLRFELRYHLAQPSTRAAGAVFLLLGGFFSRVTLGGDGVGVAAPFSVALNLGLLSLLGVFPVSVLTARTMLRDEESGMADLVRCAPVGGIAIRSHVLAGLSVTTLAVALLAVLPMAGLPLVLGGAAAVGPAVTAARHLLGVGLILVPNLLLLVAFLSLVGRLGGSAMAVHVGGIGIFLGYFGLSMWVGSPLIAGSVEAGRSLAGTLLDPFGLVGLLEQTRGWTTHALNTRPVGLSREMLANRALWLGLAAVFGGLAARVPGAVGGGRARPGTAGTTDPDPVPAPPRFGFAPQSPGSWRHRVASVVSGSRMQLRSQLGRVPVVIIVVAWVALAVLGLRESVGDGPPFFDTPYRPLTELVVPALFHPFQLVGSLIMIYLASELAWSDRISGMHHLGDPTPVPDGVRFSSTAGALAATAAALVALLVATAVVYQAARGGRPDWPLYGGLFYLLGAPWLLVGVLTVGIQLLSPDRHLGMLVAAVALVFWRPFALNVFGLDFPLLFPGWVPAPEYSVFAGFEPSLPAFHGYAAHWSILCVLVAILAAPLWWRGTEVGLRQRLSRWRASAAGGTRRRAWTAAGGLLVTGAVLFVGRVDQGWTVDVGHEERWRAAYETRLSPLAGLAVPSVERMELAFDAFPDDRRYEVGGRYRIRNDSGAPLDSVLVGWDRGITNRRVSLEGGRLVAEYRPFNHFLFVLEPSLPPGDSAIVTFAMAVDQTAFGPFDPDDAMIRDGSFVRLERKLPWIGYRSSLELTAPDTRRAHGLAAGVEEGSDPLPPDPTVPRDVTVVLTASTSGDQEVVAPGRRTRTWSRAGRNHFRFESAGPGRVRLGLASGAWDRATDEIPDLRIRLLHHPRHDANVPIVRDAARASLRLYRERFGSLARRDVTVAEIPSYGRDGIAATSYPGVVYVREHGGYTGDFRELHDDEVHYLYRRIAHELAHQWWGDLLDPDRTRPGAAVLTESLAEHSAGLVLEDRFGPAARRALLRWNERQYLRWRRRAAAPEPALVDVTRESAYVARFKGPIVLGAVADEMGRDRFRQLLRAFMDDLRTRPAGTATVGMLYDRIRRRLPERRHSLLESEFRESGAHDLSIAGVEIRPLAEGGRHELRIAIRADPEAADRDGSGDSPIGPVELEIRGEAPGAPSARSSSPRDVGDGGSGELVASRRVQVRTGRRTYRFVVDFRPSRITVDPGITRVDLDRSNNVWTAPEDRGTDPVSRRSSGPTRSASAGDGAR